MTIFVRAEGAIIPEGISITETEAAVYIRRRIEDHIWTIRITRDDSMITYEEDMIVQIDPKKWHCIWGIKG